MSPIFENIPPNSKVIAKHGSKVLFGLRNGSTALYDSKSGSFRRGDDADLMAMDDFSSSHNGEWADDRLRRFAASRKTLNLGSDVSFKVVQKPRKSSSQDDVAQPQDLTNMLPREFVNWARSYVPGQLLPISPLVTAELIRVWVRTPTVESPQRYRAPTS